MNPARLCSRYERCSVNNCPLDPGYPNLLVGPDDREKSCPMEKGVRIRAASQFPPGTLPYSGLTLREHTAKARYDSLSLAVRTQMANDGRERLKRLREAKEGKIASGE